MKLTDDNTARTHWTDEDGAEWDIKILFTFQEFEPEQPNPDLPGVGPKVDAGIVDMQIMRLDMWDWEKFDGATDKEEAEWAVEIHELINKQAADEAEEDMSEGTIWGRGA